MAGRRFDIQHIVNCIIIGVFGVLAAACQAQATTALSPSSLIQADLRSSSVYRFHASPYSPTTLLIEAESPDTAFMAELHDTSGRVVAAVSSGTLRTAALTVDAGDEIYEVIMSSANPQPAGSVSISLVTPTTDSPAVPPTRAAVAAGTGSAAVPVAYSISPTAKRCSLNTDQPSGITLRGGPGMAYAVVHTVPPNIGVLADRRTADGWYRVAVDGLMGWVSDVGITLMGLCNSLPVENANTEMLGVGGAVIPGVTAPYDRDTHYFSVDTEDGGRFSEAVSYPAGDITDRILLSIGQAPEAGSVNARTFMLTLVCSGTGIEFVRWGPPENPNQRCNHPQVLPSGLDAHSLVVMLPGAVGQSYVDYVLQVEPIAPVDQEVFIFALDRDSAGQFGEVISAPNGDRTDPIQLHVANLTDDPASSYREFTLSLVCSGRGVEAVRWGVPENPALSCGSTAIVPFSQAANLQNLVITLPEGSQPAYVNYTLRLAPAAPRDSDEFLFGLDRDSGGQLNETISHPDGDRRDTLRLFVTNLSERPPHNYREFDVMLICSGVGAAQVRWGAPENPSLLCGSTIKLPFIYGFGQTLVIQVPDGSSQSYVSYTLVATPSNL